MRDAARFSLIARRLAICVVLVVALAPVVWLISIAYKPTSDIFASPPAVAMTRHRRSFAICIAMEPTPLDAAKTYKVAGWASVNPQDGKPVADVFAAHLRGMKQAQPKKLNKVAIKGLGSNPGVAG